MKLGWQPAGSRHALLVAHRGASDVAPENTMAAVESALHAGVDAIEIDVQRTADGVPVLVHDDTWLRTTGVDEAVRAEVAALTGIALGVAVCIALERVRHEGAVVDSVRDGVVIEVAGHGPGVPTKERDCDEKGASAHRFRIPPTADPGRLHARTGTPAAWS